MSFTNLDAFTQDISDLPISPTPSGGYTGITLKAYWDINPEILRNALNSLMDELESRVANSSGASNVGVEDITGFASAFDVQGALEQIAAYAIAHALDTDTVETSFIQDLAVTTAKIALLAVDTGQLAAGAVETVKIDDLAVTTAKLATDAVTNVKIGTGAVDTDELAADAVTTVKITNLNVTEAKLASNAVTNTKVSDNAIDTAELADSAVETVKINNLAVTTAKIAALNVTAAKIANDTITATQVVTALKPGVVNGSATLDAGGDVPLSQLGNAPAGTNTFLDQTDTPSDFTDDALKLVRVNAGETALEFSDPVVDTDTFLELTDTPGSFSGQGDKIVAVNTGGTALEFIDAGSGGSSIFCKASFSGSQNLSTGSTALIEIDNLVHGDSDMFDALTYTITIPETGLYSLKAGLEVADNSTGYRNIRIYINGSSADGLDYNFPGFDAGLSNSQSFANEVILTVDDEITLRGYQNSGGDLAVKPFDTFLSVRKVGE